MNIYPYIADILLKKMVMKKIQSSFPFADIRNILYFYVTLVVRSMTAAFQGLQGRILVDS